MAHLHAHLAAHALGLVNLHLAALGQGQGRAADLHAQTAAVALVQIHAAMNIGVYVSF